MLCLLAMVAGCRRSKPSPEYAEAAALHSVLVARLGDDAYADPEMDRAVGLLVAVPPESSDLPAAEKLMQLIGTERQRIAAEAAARAKQLASPPAAEPPTLEQTETLPAGVGLD